MKVAFAGTPAFARAALEGIVAAGFDVPLVLTQPDRAAGRGMQPQASPVKQCALAHGMALAQPRSLRLDGKYPEDARAARAALEAARADVLVVAAYGLLLPQWLLDMPPHGCLNIHASVLPRWRGAAPIQRAIEAGDAHTGITIMHMDAGLDTGDIALVEHVPIHPEDTSASVHDRLAHVGARLIVKALHLSARGALPRHPQPQNGVCYAAKIDKGEARVDWRESAETIARRIRAFNPAPGAATVWRGQTIKLWQAQAFTENPYNTQAAPGTVLATGRSHIYDSTGLPHPFDSGRGYLDIACGQGSALRVTQLQRSGGKRLTADAFLHGCDIRPGNVAGN